MNAMVGRFLTAMLFLGSFANKYALCFHARQKAASALGEDCWRHLRRGAGSTHDAGTLPSHPRGATEHQTIASCCIAQATTASRLLDVIHPSCADGRAAAVHAG